MRLTSLWVLVLFLFEGLLVTPGMAPVAQAGSNWVFTSLTDFQSGNLTGLAVNGAGVDASLEIARTYPGWSQKSPASHPSARISYMAAVYGSDALVLFGAHGPGGILGDTWAYDLSDNAWWARNPPSSPPPRYDSSLATIYSDDKVMLFGGDDQARFCDTWVYDLGDDRWIEKSPANHPGPRDAFGMAGVYGTGKVVLFGGHKEDGSLSAETWIYDLDMNGWTLSSPPVSPPGRSYGMMASVSGDDKVVLFGGLDATGRLGDTWIYDAGDGKWSQKSPADSPSPRMDSAISTVYDDDKIVLFGGDTGHGQRISDTWSYDIGSDEWTSLNPAKNPSSNDGTRMAGIFGTDTSILFGGLTSNSIWTCETWAHKLSSYRSGGTYLTPPREIATEYSLLRIEWNATAPASAKVGAMIRTAQSKDAIWTTNYQGPGGSPSEHYKSGDSLWSGYSGRWVQILLSLTTTDKAVTPTVRDLTLTYNRLPGPPILLAPYNESWLPGRPTFSWRISDADGDAQSAFTWQLSSSPEFATIKRSADDRKSDIANYTPESPLPEGLWYWRVRTADRDGGWGCYSAPWTIRIDLSPPEPFEPAAKPSGWTCSNPQISFVSTDDGSGIAGYEASVDDGAFTRQVSPFVPDLADGRHNLTVRAFDLTGNYVDGKVACYKDAGPPENLTILADPPGWSRVSGSISFTADDATSGISRYEVKIDNNPSAAQSSPYGLPDLTDGNHTATVRAFDKAGNYLERSAAIEIDKGLPLQFKVTGAPSGWTATDPNLSFMTNDSTSAIDRYELSVDDGPFENVTSPCTLNGLSDGAHNVTVRAVDLAGNFRDSKAVVKIDRTAPSNVALAIFGGAGGTTSQKVKLSVSAFDNTSGLDRMCFSTDGISYSPWEPFSDEYELILSEGVGKKTVYVKVIDAAGNEAAPASAAIDYRLPASPDSLMVPMLSLACIVIAAAVVSALWLRSRRRASKK